MGPSTIHIRRAYDEPAADDGLRVLVDRLWPRGVKKDAAKIDVWLKQVAPSDELRQWFDHDPDKWGEFRKRYLKELAPHKKSLRDLLEQGKGKPITLVFGARDVEHNNAVVLREYLRRLQH